MSKKQWKKAQAGHNLILHGDNFYISFLQQGNAGKILPGIFDSDNGSAETALCVDGCYYILNGDFRKEYEAVIDKGLVACMQIFKAHPEAKSSWSN